MENDGKYALFVYRDPLQQVVLNNNKKISKTWENLFGENSFIFFDHFKENLLKRSF